MYKSLTTDPRWTTLCICACVFQKKEQKYTVVAEIFVAIKVTVLEIKIEGIQFSSLKSNIMKYIYPVIIKKSSKDLILLINIFQDGYEIEFLNKYFCF